MTRAAFNGRLKKPHIDQTTYLICEEKGSKEVGSSQWAFFQSGKPYYLLWRETTDSPDVASSGTLRRMFCKAILQCF